MELAENKMPDASCFMAKQSLNKYRTYLSVLWSQCVLIPPLKAPIIVTLLNTIVSNATEKGSRFCRRPLWETAEGLRCSATHLVSLQGERGGRHFNMTPRRSSLHTDNAAIHHNADRARRVWLCVSLSECVERSALRDRKRKSSCANFNGKLSFFALENPSKDLQCKQQTGACQKTVWNGQCVIALGAAECLQSF